MIGYIVTILMTVAGAVLLTIHEMSILRSQRERARELRDAVRALSGKPPALRREVGRP